MNDLSEIISEWLLRIVAIWLIGGIVYGMVKLWPSVVGIIVLAPLILFGIWIFAVSFDA